MPIATNDVHEQQYNWSSPGSRMDTGHGLVDVIAGLSGFLCHLGPRIWGTFTHDADAVSNHAEGVLVQRNRLGQHF